MSRHALDASMPAAPPASLLPADPSAVPTLGGHRSALTSVARGGGFAALGSGLGAALGLVLTLVVTNSLSPTSAGHFFTATAVFLVLQTLLAFGVGAGVVRFIPRLKAVGRTTDIPTLLRVAFLPVVALGIVGSVGLWLATDSLAAGVGGSHGAELIPTFHIIAALFLPSTLEVAAVECTRGFGSIRRYVWVQQIGIPFLRPLLVAITTLAGFSLWVVVLAWLIPLAMALAIATVFIRSSLAELLGPQWRHCRPVTAWPAIMVEYWSFTAARGTAMVMDTLLTWLDVVLVASIVSAKQAAIYAAASRFITAGTLVLQALRLAMATDISAALAKGELAKVSQMYRTATQWVVLTSWPLYLVMAVFAPTVLRIFGSSYSEGATATSILCVAMMANLAAGNVGTVLIMGGRSAWVLADKTVCVLLNVGLNFALIPHLGITGAAIAWAVTILLDGSLAFSQVRWGMRIGGRLDAVVLAAGLAVICFGVVGVGIRIALGSTLVGLVATCVLGTALFTGPVLRWRVILGIDVLIDAVRAKSGRHTRTQVTA